MAMVRAMGAAGALEHRHRRASPARRCRRRSISARPITRNGCSAFENLLVERRAMSAPTRSQAGHALQPAKPLKRGKLHARRRRRASWCAAASAARRKRRRCSSAGDRVRAKNIHPATHTRLPRYVRGHIGVVERDHGVHVFPDSASHRQQATTRSGSTRSCSTGRELWGPDGDPTLKVSIDAFEPYLEPVLSGPPRRRARTRPCPSIPRDADGPVFREPWEAQAFAMALALHERGLFTWPEWAATLAEEIKRAQAAGDPDTGETYYRHWLERAGTARHREGRDRRRPDCARYARRLGPRRATARRTASRSSCGPEDFHHHD